MLVRIVTVCALVAATYWFAQEQKPESFFTTLAFFIGYLGTETYARLRRPGRLEADRQLFRKFLDQLPFEPTIDFLINHDLRDAFKSATLWPLDQFRLQWLNESHRFHDRRIETAKRNLHTLATEFLADYATNTWLKHTASESQEIPKEWRTDQPERYKIISERLNRRATEIAEAYEKLTNLARRRLDV